MVKDKKGATVEQCGADSGSLGKKAMSQTATSGSCDRAMVFGGVSSVKYNDVDTESILDCKDAGAIRSVMMQVEAPDRAKRVKLPESRASYCHFSRITTLECDIIGS